MTLSRSAFVAGAAGGFATALVGRARAADPTVVTFGYLPSLTPLNLARLRGTLTTALAPLGYTVKWAGPFAAFAPAVEALTPGSIDFTVGSATSGISAMVAGAPFKIFLYAPPSADAEGVIARRDRPIRKLEDFVGKKVAVNRGGTGEYLLTLALQRAGIAPSSVEKVYLGPADAAFAFSSGAVDGWAVWDPYLAVAEIRDVARVIARSHEIGSENATIIVARNAFAEKHPEAVKAVATALLAENRWQIAHPAEAAQLAGTDAKQDPTTIATIAKRSPYVYHAVDAKFVASLGNVAGWFAQQKIVPTVPDVKNFVLRA